MRSLLTAIAIAVGLLAGCANIALCDPMPTWNINAAALEDSSNTIETAHFFLNSPPMSAEKRAQDPDYAAREDRNNAQYEKTVKEDPEGLFKRFVRWHTKARDYVASHWSGYADDQRVFCVGWAVDTAVYWSTRSHMDSTPRSATAVNPSYVHLAMCLGPPDKFCGTCAWPIGDP